MTDWYFAGMFDETFWAEIDAKKISGRNAAEVLRSLIAATGETDIAWLSKAGLLYALCRTEMAFEIKRRGGQIHWVLNPFRDNPEASGNAGTIGEAIDALTQAAQGRQ
jgi:hypothetical protein